VVGSPAAGGPRASSWATKGSARGIRDVPPPDARHQKEGGKSQAVGRSSRSRDETCAHSHGQGSMRPEPSLVGWQAKVLARDRSFGCSSAVLRRAGQQSSQAGIGKESRRRAGTGAPRQSPSMPTRTAQRFFRRDSCARSRTSSSLKSPSRDAFEHPPTHRITREPVGRFRGATRFEHQHMRVGQAHMGPSRAVTCDGGASCVECCVRSRGEVCAGGRLRAARGGAGLLGSGGLDLRTSPMPSLVRQDFKYRSAGLGKSAGRASPHPFGELNGPYSRSLSGCEEKKPASKPWLQSRGRRTRRVRTPSRMFFLSAS